MNEQRLAELEARGDDFAKEIAAALRLEWRKRDKYVEETFANLARLEARADRAESSLSQLREAAEVLITHAVVNPETQIASVGSPWIEPLVLALSAAQDPAR